MKRRNEIVKETELHDRLFPLVEGRVFHVTRRTNLESIFESGGLHPDRKREYPTTFGSAYNSYFRNRDCVPVFDLVHPTDEQIESRLTDCWPFMPAKPGADIAILILSPDAHGDLVSWIRSREDLVPGEMIVPYVEAGYPTFLPLSLVDEIIEVEVQEVPDSFHAMHRRLRAEAGGNGAV